MNEPKPIVVCNLLAGPYRQCCRRTLRALIHELHCSECRVSWRSWRRRLIGDTRGYSPRTFG